MENKPGYKSTEFWLTLATNIAALVYTLSETLPPKYAIIASVVANGLYAISRGWAKKPTSILPSDKQ